MTRDYKLNVQELSAPVVKPAVEPVTKPRTRSGVMAIVDALPTCPRCAGRGAVLGGRKCEGARLLCTHCGLEGEVVIGPRGLLVHAWR